MNRREFLKFLGLAAAPPIIFDMGAWNHREPKYAGLDLWTEELIATNIYYQDKLLIITDEACDTPPLKNLHYPLRLKEIRA